MPNNPQHYMRSSFPVLVYSGIGKMRNSIIHDGESWENFTEDSVISYLREGTQVFSDSLAMFTASDTQYSSLQAKELRFMLEALIEVKEVFNSN